MLVEKGRGDSGGTRKIERSAGPDWKASVTVVEWVTAVMCLWVE